MRGASLSNQESPVVLEGPDPRNWLLAAPAFSVAYLHGANHVTRALHDHLATLWAVGTFCGVAWYVADVNVMQSLRFHDRLGTFERSQGRRRKVLQQVLRLKAREMDRDVWSQFGFDPTRKTFEFFIAVIQGRNDQVNDLRPHP